MCRLHFFSLWGRLFSNLHEVFASVFWIKRLLLLLNIVQDKRGSVELSLFVWVDLLDTELFAFLIILLVLQKMVRMLDLISHFIVLVL